jgi:predicted AAA+ superfamily ATPase
MKLAPKNGFPSVLHDKLWNLMLHYFIVGGLPEVVKTYVTRKSDYVSAFSAVRRLQATLYKNYLADMSKHCGKVNAMHLERVFKSVPEQLSREQDSSAPKFKFKDVIPKIKDFHRLAGTIDWLEKAGLIVKVSIANQGLLPFSAYCKENSFKLFMFDIGMMGALSNLPPKTILDYDYGTYKGFFAENFVLQELLTCGHETVYSWQESTAQVEFLLEENGAVIPLEVKAGSTIKHAKSLGVFASKYNPPYRVKISGRPLPERKSEDVLNCPLYLVGSFFLNSKTQNTI